MTGSRAFAFGQGVFSTKRWPTTLRGSMVVAMVEAVVHGAGVQVIGTDGEPIGGGGPPQFGALDPVGEDQVAEQATSFVIREGRAPAATARWWSMRARWAIGGFALGDPVSIVSTTAGSPRNTSSSGSRFR